MRKKDFCTQEKAEGICHNLPGLTEYPLGSATSRDERTKTTIMKHGNV